MVSSSAAQVMIPSTGGSDSSEAAAELPDPLTPEAIQALVARMSDQDVRTMLLNQLEAVAASSGGATQQQTGVFAELGGIATRMGEDIMDAAVKVPLLVTNQAKSLANFTENYGGFGGVVTMLALIAVALAAGFALERLVIFLTRNWQGTEVEDSHDNLWGALRYLFLRFLREIIGLIGFYIGLRIVGRLLLDPHQLQFAAPFVLYLIWMPRVAAAFSRMILAPKRADLRLVNISDKWAKYLHRNQIGLIFLGAFTVWIVGFNARNGVPMGDSRLGFWLNTAVHVYIGIMAWRAREGLSDMMRGTDPDNTRSDEWVARIYPYFAIGVTVGMWVIVEIVAGYGQFALLATAPHFTTMFWLLMAPLLDSAIRGLVRHLQPPIIGEGPVAEAAYKSTKRSFIRIGRVVVGGIVILLIANAWQIDLISLRGEDTAGANFFQFLITLAIGYVVFEGVGLWVNRRLAREQTSREISEDEAAGEGGGGAGNSRLATVLPLVRVTIQVAIAVIFFLLALGNLGIDITPLLAGAGILGLAIGFGAQKLVADIVGGIFFLIDDAFRVGEYVDVGGTMGTVEKISIRSMQLRHHRGAVHTIPYGEIQKLTNFSRDWVIMKLMFTVPFDTDPNKIKKIFKKIGAEMMTDETHGPGFLEPFKSQGVFSFDDVGMVVRGKFMAKPGSQFTIRKEIYNRVKREFDAAGIDFARREVRVAIPGLENAEDMSDFEKTAAAGGAAGAVQAATETKA
ncbi:MAG: mechanosensitive ion channel family protein [Paracoccaceae bacterium]